MNSKDYERETAQLVVKLIELRKGLRESETTLAKARSSADSALKDTEAAAIKPDGKPADSFLSPVETVASDYVRELVKVCRLEQSLGDLEAEIEKCEADLSKLVGKLAKQS